MKVSVLVITYNHEPFITQAIQSALAQETLFDYEIVVGEDCSTDNTRAILLEMQQQYPDKIRLLLQEKNLGMLSNFSATLSSCRGQYIAMLEGDDYWTSPHKLQKQVEFMETHPECSICAHVAQIVDENNHPINEIPAPKYRQTISTLENLLEHNFVPTCSVIFRRGLFGELPEWFFTLTQGDWPLHVLNAQFGKIGFLNETMAAYRLHINSVWSTTQKTHRLRAIIHTYGVLDEHLQHRYHHLIQRMIWKYQYDLAVAYESNGEITNARRCIKACLIPNWKYGGITRRKLIETMIRLYTPIIYQLMRTAKTAISPGKK